MKENYQKQLDSVLNHIAGVPKVLLHSCCGPCSSYVMEYLSRFFQLTILFYNPNIQPETEYEKRLYWQKQIISQLPTMHPVSFLEQPWDPQAFEEIAAGLEMEPEGGARCTRCFELRLEKTARLAAAYGFDFFATTLTVSPHKNAERINRLGYALGEKYGVAWLPSDFKKREGYKRSIELSKQYGLYRQDYCGCLYSRGEPVAFGKEDLSVDHTETAL
jgi:predicted adenine nucleotide alpha hydrolase (AANH) superfamily ATPase